MLYPTPQCCQGDLPPAARWRCRDLLEELEGVWECRGRQKELLLFPPSPFNPGRQQAYHLLWRILTLRQPNPVRPLSPLSSTQSWWMRTESQGEQKGGIKGKALFSLRVEGLTVVEQRYLTAPCRTLGSNSRPHLLWLRWLHTRHNKNNFSVSFKNVWNDALQSHPPDIPCFDPFLTWELTLNCSMCRQGSKARNFQTQKGEKLFSPPKKAERR